MSYSCPMIGCPGLHPDKYGICAVIEVLLTDFKRGVNNGRIIVAQFEALRAELKKFKDLETVHLSSGGRSPDEKIYTKKDVEMLVSVIRLLDRKESP